MAGGLRKAALDAVEAPAEIKRQIAAAAPTSAKSCRGPWVPHIAFGTIGAHKI
jgi:hypothetical protein